MRPAGKHRSVRSTLGRTLAALAAVVLTCVAIIGACSQNGSKSSSGDPSADGSETPQKPPVTTRVVVGKVVGTLRAVEKQPLKDDVKEIVDGFFENAYLGEFPRTSYDEAYAAFTAGARKDAERDQDLLSNSPLSDQIETATGAKRQVALDVFAVKGKAQGVTAHFTLDFTTAGGLEQRQRIKGYLLLDHEGGDWHVFGYDLFRRVIA
jgi:hypothetical protein